MTPGELLQRAAAMRGTVQSWTSRSTSRWMHHLRVRPLHVKRQRHSLAAVEKRLTSSQKQRTSLQAQPAKPQRSRVAVLRLAAAAAKQEEQKEVAALPLLMRRLTTTQKQLAGQLETGQHVLRQQYDRSLRETTRQLHRMQPRQRLLQASSASQQRHRKGDGG